MEFPPLKHSAVDSVAMIIGESKIVIGKISGYTNVVLVVVIVKAR